MACTLSWFSESAMLQMRMRHGVNYLHEKAGLIHPCGLIGASQPYRKSGYTPAVIGVNVKFICATAWGSSPNGRHKKTANCRLRVTARGSSTVRVSSPNR
ncbi:hypothetical protein VAWG004_25590 [Aeromonas veronii]|nr:hypothetical protein VAWG004_25590 [Aeromonas veronii]